MRALFSSRTRETHFCPDRIARFESVADSTSAAQRIGIVKVAFVSGLAKWAPAMTLLSCYLTLPCNDILPDWLVV